MVARGLQRCPRGGGSCLFVMLWSPATARVSAYPRWVAAAEGVGDGDVGLGDGDGDFGDGDRVADGLGDGFFVVGGSEGGLVAVTLEDCDGAGSGLDRPPPPWGHFKYRNHPGPPCDVIQRA